MDCIQLVYHQLLGRENSILHLWLTDNAQRKAWNFLSGELLLQDSHTCKHESLWGSSRNSKQFERKEVKEEKLIFQVSRKLSAIRLTIMKSMLGVVASFIINDF